MAASHSTNADTDLIVAIDLGGTRFRVAAVTRDGRVLRRAAEQTRAYEGLDTVLARLYGTVREVAGDAPRPPRAIGVAAPGPLDPWTGVIFDPPNMPGWDKVPLKDLMEREFNIRVAVGNDANVAALGEHRFGAGRGLTDVVYITVSTGVGGGIISANRLVLGANGLAGEIGHMTILPEGPECGCGNFGCLEALSSGTAIAKRARQAMEGGAPSALLAMAGGDLTRVNAELVASGARNGDVLAGRVLREAGEYLGIGVANVVSLLNPQMVIIGGGVSNIGNLIFDPVWDVVKKRTMVAMRRDLRIVPAMLGDDAGLVGCAALALGPHE